MSKTKTKTMRTAGQRVATITLSGTIAAAVPDGVDAREHVKPILAAWLAFGEGFTEREGMPDCAAGFSAEFEVENAPAPDPEGDRAAQVERIRSAVGLSTPQAERLVSIMRGES